MKILVLPRFIKQYKRLPVEIRKLASEKETVFRKNPFDSQLKTHRLRGNFEGFWSFSIHYKYRIIFEFADEETAIFYSIGTHQIYE